MSAEAQPVYLSLGSNLGDRSENLRRAVEMLGGEIRVNAVSWMYESEPVGVRDQPAFLNLAVVGETELAPHELLAVVKRIERDVGRRPTFRWGPRVVDIDIVLYGGLVLETAELTIPHREMVNRAFVLAPLAEIAGSVVHPVRGETIAELAEEAPGRETVVRLGPLT